MSQKEHDRQIDYVEFTTSDIEKTKLFYSAIFNWSFTDWGEEYTSFEDGRLAGGFQSVDSVKSEGTLVVIYGADLESLRTAVKENGGTIVKEIFSFPGGRRFHFQDPTGNVLAVWSDS